MQPQFANTVKTRTAARTLLVALATIYSDDVIRTAFLAAPGAAVIFGALFFEDSRPAMDETLIKKRPLAASLF